MDELPLTPQILWLTADRTRRFLLPVEMQFSDGTDTIRSIRGEVRQVALETLLPYEISEAQAQAWAWQELGRIAQQLRRAVRPGALGAQSTIPSEGDHAGPSAHASSPGLDLLAELSRTPRQSLDGEQGAIGQALGSYFRDIGATVADAISGDPARIARSQERMASWAATLEQHGVPTPATPPERDEPLSTGHGQDTAGRSQGTAATTRSASPSPQPDPGDSSEDPGLAASLRSLAEHLRRRADALAAARQSFGAQPTPPEDPLDPG
jgi:hypothetical protein